VVGAIDCSPNALPPTQSRNRADFLIWVSRNSAWCRVFSRRGHRGRYEFGAHQPKASISATGRGVIAATSLNIEVWYSASIRRGKSDLAMIYLSVLCRRIERSRVI
jgi:hypothetical protein